MDSEFPTEHEQEIVPSLDSKNWKARQAAYLQIQITDHEDVQQAIKKVPLDTNMVAQEAGMDLLVKVSSLQYFTPNKLIEKCLASSRQGIRAKAIAVLVNLYAFEQQQVLDALLVQFGAKLPKLVAASVASARSIIEAYGLPKEIKPVFKLLPQLFGHSDATVRSEAQQLTVVLFRWIRNVDLFESQLFSHLRDVQVKELQDAFIAAAPVSKQKFIDGEVNEQTSATAQALDQVMAEPFLVQIDLSEPVDVLSKIPKNLEAKLAEPKWLGRKTAMEELLAVLNTPLYVHSQSFNNLLNILAKRVSDVHLVVSALAIECIQRVAIGLRNDFGQYKHLVLSGLLDRLKEKKQTQVLRDALDAIFKSLKGVGDILSDLMEAMTNKNPLMRSEATYYLARCLLEQKSALIKAEVKQAASSLTKLVADSVPEVRDNAMKAMGALIKLNGEDVLSLAQDLDSVRLEKIKEYANVVPGKENKPSYVAVPKSVARPSIDYGQTKKKTTSRLVKSSASVKVGSAKSLQVSATNPVSEEVLSFHWTEDGVQEQAEIIFGAQVVKGMNDAVWKIRLEAVQSLTSQLNKATEVAHPAELLVCLLKSKQVWKDSNFQVMNQVVGLLQKLSLDENVGMTKSSTFLCLPLLIEKTADNKVRTQSVATLRVLTEKFGAAFVLKEFPACVQAQKSPKNISEILKAASELLKDYGVSGADIKLLIAMSKEQISSPNQLIRTAIIGLLTVLRVHVGPAISSLLDDVSPAQLTLIDAEFAKVADIPRPVVHKSHASSEVNAELLTQRVDLNLPSSVINDLVNSNWKIRKEALEAILQNLKAAQYCINIPSLELFSALKLRLSDGNKILVAATLELLGQLCKSIGSPIQKHLKSFCSEIVGCLNDNKAQVRQAVITCLDQLQLVCSQSLLYDMVFEGLSSQSSSTKTELLDWLSANPQIINTECLAKLGKVYEQCFVDKTQDVRRSAQKLLAVIVQSLGYDLAATYIEPSALEPYMPSQANVKSGPGTPLAVKRLTKTSTPSRPVSQSSLKTKDGFDFPLLMNDAQEKRQSQDKGSQKWNYTPERQDLVLFLSEQCIGCVSSQMCSLMFSNNPSKEKDHIQALTVLVAIVSNTEMYGLAVSEANGRIIACSDLLFKYMAIRLYDTNTTIVLKCLDLFTHLLELCDNGGYHLSDYEASACLPVLVMKLGDAKEIIRQKVRNIVSKLFCRVYPVSKVCMFLIKGLSDKNARVRIECLDVLSGLVVRNGVHILGQLSRSISSIASQVADRDSSVRNAAIQCIVSVYELIGEQLFKYTSELSDRDLGFIKDKIRRQGVVAGETPQKSRPTSQDVKTEQVRASLISLQSNSDKDIVGSNESVQTSHQNQRKFSLELDTINLGKVPSQITSPDVGIVPLNTMDNTYAMDFLLTQISGDIYQSTDALKKLERLIHDDYQQVSPQLNQIVMAITLQVRLAFTSPIWKSGGDHTSLLRLCKHLVNALVQMFSNAHLARQLEVASMNPLLAEILTHLTSPVQGPNVQDAGTQLTRALNVLMLRILDLCDKNDLFQTLLDLLESSFEKLDESVVQQKYAELVMKCLWKLTKTLADLVRSQGIRVADLLLSLHRFCCRTPPQEWKIRAQQKKPLTDMPYRTMKTITHEIALSAGEQAVRDMLNISEISDPSKSVVYIYLTQMVSQVKPTDEVIPDLKGVESHIKSDPKDNQQAQAQSSSTELDAIFTSINDKDKSVEGIQRLKEYLIDHPQSRSDVDSRLSVFGSHFRKFVVTQLDDVQTKPSQDSDADVYKQRLSRLQQQMAATTPQKQQAPLLSQTPKNNSVDSIKARLAQMKSSMANLGIE